MRAKGKKGVEVVTPLVRTVKKPYTDWRNDSVVPNWDSVPGVAQHASRTTRNSPPTNDGAKFNPAMRDDHPKL